MTYLAAFLIAGLAAWGLTPLAGRVSRRFGIVDRPNPRKIHLKPTPKGGGASIVAGFLLAAWGVCWVYGKANSGSLGYLSIVTIAVAGVGWLDDKVELGAWNKLAGLVVPVVLWNLGRHPFSLVGFLHVVLDTGFLLLAMNAINLLDGMDGLVAGVSCLAAVSLAAAAISIGDSTVALLAFALAGGTAGFLPHNFQPAWIFMGDTGSLAIGFVLGALALQTTGTGVLSPRLPIALGMLAVPLFDTLITILRRWKHRRPLFAPDKSHTYNLLVADGFSYRTVVYMCYGATVLFGVLGVLYANVVAVSGRVGLIALTVLLMLGVALRFNFLRVDSAGDKVDKRVV